jgi:putative phosphoribosyl transferase
VALFPDRTAAGRELGAELARRLAERDVVVLGLPRGGVPVAAEVARALDAPLDVFVVRKLGTPGHPELAMGAVASGGTRVLNEGVLRRLGVPATAVEREVERQTQELVRREQAYRGARPLPELRGRTALLVDDGLATGATVRAAVVAVRELAPAAVVVAVPVGAPEACAALAEVADDVVCLYAPAQFAAVGVHYADFTQTSDEQVQALLGS